MYDKLKSQKIASGEIDPVEVNFNDFIQGNIR
jgi:hypothetical protein